jgi:hypothetical protein
MFLNFDAGNLHYKGHWKGLALKTGKLYEDRRSHKKKKSTSRNIRRNVNFCGINDTGNILKSLGYKMMSLLENNRRLLDNMLRHFKN